MPFDFEPLLRRIDNTQQGIKLELFHETATIIEDLCHKLGTNEIAPAVLPSVQALSESDQVNGRAITYRGLHAFLHSPMFATMARSTDPAASCRHFQQLVILLRSVVGQVPVRTIDETRTYRINSLLNRADIHARSAASDQGV